MTVRFPRKTFYYNAFTSIVAVDGDTVKMTIDHGLRVASTDVIARLIGIQAPESRTAVGSLVTQILSKLIEQSSHAEFTSEAMLSSKSPWYRPKMDGYGRMLGTLMLERNGVRFNVADWLVEHSIAVKWDGIGKAPTFNAVQLGKMKAYASWAWNLIAS